MKKVLIWDLNFKLQNTGGPAGYLYNVKSYLDTQSEESNIFFLSEFIKEKNSDDQSLISQKAKKSKNRIIVALTDIYRTLRFLNNKCPQSIIKSVDLSKFDVIHFHSPLDLYLAIDVIKEYKGIVLLTSHSPEPLSSEIVNHIYGDRKPVRRDWSYKKLSGAECEGFKRADYIMFPTKYSIEPYFVDNNIRKILEKKESRIVYCPTGILDTDKKPRNNSFFVELCGVPLNSFVVVYIGRHNNVKGYGDLQKIAETLINKHSDIYFVIAGKEGPLPKLESKQWIELGWTDKAPDIIRNADTFILPNRETYFDIVALEVLRAGTPLVLTSTGGNKYFAEITSIGNGIFAYDRLKPEECVNAIENLIYAKKEGKLDAYRECNRKIWEENFTLSSYVSKYRKMIESL